MTKAEGVVAIDGKTSRRSFDRASGASPLHMAGTFASEARSTLGRVSVAEKSNEIVASRVLAVVRARRSVENKLPRPPVT